MIMVLENKMWSCSTFHYFQVTTITVYIIRWQCDMTLQEAPVVSMKVYGLMAVKEQVAHK